MTNEEIIEMVKQTDLLGIIDSQYYENESWIPDVVKFAKLVAENEREKCAKIAEWHKQMAFDIRARGQE